MRLPNRLDKSEFIFNINNSLLNTPSFPKLTSRKRKYLIESIGKCCDKIIGSITLPWDLDILFPSIRSQPCPNTCFGSGRFSANSIIGQ